MGYLLRRLDRDRDDFLEDERLLERVDFLLEERELDRGLTERLGAR